MIVPHRWPHPCSFGRLEYGRLAAQDLKSVKKCIMLFAAPRGKQSVARELVITHAYDKLNVFKIYTLGQSPVCIRTAASGRVPPPCRFFERRLCNEAVEKPATTSRIIPLF